MLSIILCVGGYTQVIDEKLTKERMGPEKTRDEPDFHFESPSGFQLFGDNS
jgi:hypothetical protein